MCTMTVVPRGEGELRIAVNRDESGERPAALPPTGAREFGPRQGILPIDPVGGGTWVAANDAGLAFTLLNRRQPTDRRPTTLSLHSRGLIIPAVLSSGSLAEATHVAAELDLGQFLPFRLVIVDARVRSSFRRTGSTGSR